MLKHPFLRSIVAIAAATQLIAAGAPALHPPSTVTNAIPHLREIRSVAALPRDIRIGSFVGSDGKGPSNWALADPGAPFSSGDAIYDPNLPRRQLVFAACDDSVCIVHYRLGGSGESDNILALERVTGDQKSMVPCSPSWAVTWFASGHPPLPNFAALRALLQGNGAKSYGYIDTESRGDLF